MKKELKIVFSYSQSVNKNFWEKWLEDLRKNLEGTFEISYYFPDSISDEIKILRKEKIDLFFGTLTFGICELLAKDFTISGVCKNVSTYPLVLLSLKPIKLCEKNISIGLINHFSSLGTLLIINFQFKIPWEKILERFYSSYQEIIEKLENREIDAGVIERLPFFEKKLKGFYTEPLMLPNNLYLAVPKNKEDFLKDLILKNKELFKKLGLEFIDFWRKKTLIIYNYISTFLKDVLEEHNLLTRIKEHFPIGILIYKERYVYLNSYASSLLGYSLEEFQKLKPEDIFYYEKDKKEINNIVKRRLAGEEFIRVYKEIALKRKDGKKVICWCVSGSFYYKDSYAGLVLLRNITKEIKIERFNKTILDINTILIKSGTEKEIFQKLQKTLIENLRLSGLILVVFKEESTEVERIEAFSENLKEIFDRIKGKLLTDSTVYSCIKRAFETKKVFIVSDLKKYADDPEIKRLFEAGIRSVCSIPIVVDGKVVSILSLYHQEEDFFDKTILRLMEEIQKDISYAIKKVIFHRKHYIISEFVNKVEDFFIIAKEDGSIEYMNPYTVKNLEFSESDLEKDIFTLLNLPEELKKFLNRKFFKSGRFIKKIKRNNKEIIMELELFVITIFSDIKRIVLLGKDISREKNLEEELYRLENFDELTGLLNLKGFFNKIQDLFQMIKKEAYLMFIDLYSFTDINRFYGIESGNLVLKEIGRRLTTIIGDKGIVGRTGSDEFVILFIETEEKEINQILQMIKDVFSVPVSLDYKKIPVEFNAGIVVYPTDGREVKELWEKVNILVKNLKRKGPNIIEFFNPKLEIQAHRVLKTSELIRKAFKENLFLFYYHPYYEINTLKIFGLEALVRIKSKDKKIILPEEFIDYLENSPYIKDFERLSFKKNLENIKKFKFPISINVSSQSIATLAILEYLEECKDLIEELPTYFVIEITERVLTTNIENAKKALYTLKDKYNVKIALDDFGTGYSSLTYLKNFPIDIIKLDRSFVKEILKDKKAYYITQSIVELAINLGIELIAEGIEEKKQLLILKELFCSSTKEAKFCNYAQGFFLSKPLPEKEIEKLLKLI